MSVKKMGSKLAQGIRQAKSTEKKGASPHGATPAKTAAPAKRAVATTTPATAVRVRSTAAAPAKDLHPQRVWPD